MYYAYFKLSDQLISNIADDWLFNLVTGFRFKQPNRTMKHSPRFSSTLRKSVNICKKLYLKIRDISFAKVYYEKGEIYRNT